MSETVSRLGQVTGTNIPTGTTLYTCPTNTQTVLSSINIANRKGSGTSITIWHVDGAFGDRADEDAVAWNHDLLPFRTLNYRLGITMTATDTIIVKTSGSTYPTFIAWGSEIS